MNTGLSSVIFPLFGVIAPPIYRWLGVRHFLAYYDLETDRLYGRFTWHKKAKDFLSFLRWVRSRYPRGQKLYIVVDNYGPHITSWC
jgi:hypothetical protein